MKPVKPNDRFRRRMQISLMVALGLALTSAVFSSLESYGPTVLGIETRFGDGSIHWRREVSVPGVTSPSLGKTIGMGLRKTQFKSYGFWGNFSRTYLLTETHRVHSDLQRLTVHLRRLLLLLLPLPLGLFGWSLVRLRRVDRLVREGRCVSCGYLLANLTECPECGTSSEQ